MYTGGVSEWAVALQWIGGGAGLLGIARILKVLLDYLNTHLDRRAAMLAAREIATDLRSKQADELVARWQRALERDFRTLKSEVAVYRAATNMLVSALHRENPESRVLAEVEQMLAPYRVVSMAEPDEDLVNKLRETD